MRFAKNPKIQLHRVALSSTDGRAAMASNGVSSSFSSEGSILVPTISFGTFTERIAQHKIDLLKLNVEGAEYDILNDMIDTRQIERVTDIQVQFHDFVPDAETKLERIRQRLSATHRPTYQYTFVWENWHLR
jgi:FkbM family methyltransferase